MNAANREAVDLIKRWRGILKPGFWNEFFMHWRFYPAVGRYVDGYICPPCPNCGDEVMWYRESTWQYDPNGHIEHGKQCEKCNHYWNDRTGEVWLQGMSREEFVKYWHLEPGT